MRKQHAGFWHRMHAWPRRRRWPLKVGAFLVLVTFVLYPKVWLLARQIGRLTDMNAMLQPELPALGELEESARAQAGDELAPEQVLQVVERLVCQRIPYAWDWDVWGVVDYLPTTQEVLEKGREDCDGRAVLAAALLRRIGYDAWLVSDMKHMWVGTPEGETMSPGQGEKTFEGGEAGTRLKLSAGTLANLGRGLAFGVAVFPLTRELIILAALCGLTMHPYSSVRRRVAGCLLLLLALGLVHDSGATPRNLAGQPVMVWVGAVVGLVGWLLLAVKGAGRRWSGRRPG